ncbi:hypothetical protein BJP34_14980 [Moorena producens PAL-8-15-08-1]|uniref:Uncharacterized protein n=1 Tax=Moorena producens PAL-8-15-08-1 TaxID=1458985 RepID=A0A1D8TSL4_9CYAN|nr:hypothetical protein [Moorena producens]AOX00575.1 hypothetical protein BJP34_14980 [Moorena producens PAL-8-15-08-1]
MLKVFQRFTVILLSVTLIFVSLATKPALASGDEPKILTEVYILETEDLYQTTLHKFNHEQLIVPNLSHKCTDGKTDAISFYVNELPLFDNLPLRGGLAEGLTTLVIGEKKTFPPNDDIGSADTRVIPVIEGQNINDILNHQIEGSDIDFLVFSPEEVGQPGMTCQDVQELNITGKTEKIQFLFDSTGLESLFRSFDITMEPTDEPTLFVVVAQIER